LVNRPRSALGMAALGPPSDSALNRHPGNPVVLAPGCARAAGHRLGGHPPDRVAAGAACRLFRNLASAGRVRMASGELLTSGSDSSCAAFPALPTIGTDCLAESLARNLGPARATAMVCLRGLAPGDAIVSRRHNGLRRQGPSILRPGNQGSPTGSCEPRHNAAPRSARLPEAWRSRPICTHRSARLARLVATTLAADA